MEGADRIVDPDGMADLLPETDLLVLALALTSETEGVIGAAELAALPETAWLVNVARGGHVQTDALVDGAGGGFDRGSRTGRGGSRATARGPPALDRARCLLTPHVGKHPAMAVPLLSARITENVRRFAAGEPLLGLVDPDAGY